LVGEKKISVRVRQLPLGSVRTVYYADKLGGKKQIGDNYMIQAIVTDLDKTLLQKGAIISDYTISVLRACQQKNIKIVFATARSTKATSRIFEQFLPDIFIGYGGAVATEGKNIIHQIDIPVDISNNLIKESLNTPEVVSVLAINESVALTSCIGVLNDKDSSHYKYADFLNDYNYRFLKISLNATCQAAVEKIAANYPMLDMLRYTGEDLYRFANRDAVKWNALKAVGIHCKINTDDFVAFGDDKNDLEMLAMCGIGIAVENAIDEVKAVADYICGPNESDGVGKWIEKHIL